MEMMVDTLNWALLMDILALGASVFLIGWLIFNRIRYGHLVLRPNTATTDFTSEMALQVVTQQFQHSYHQIQQTLQHEFDNLQRLTGGDRHSWPAGDGQICRADHRASKTEAVPQHAGRYHQAFGMIQKGVDHRDIAQRCGLANGEIDLINYMHQNQS